MAAASDAETPFEFVASNLPATARASGKWTLAAGRAKTIQAAPWPADAGLLSGSRPAVIVTNHAEIVEAAASDKPQEISAAPVGISGRIAKAGEQDRYRLAVTPGQALRFDVLAHRAGSPLDGVLSIQNEQGGELANSDDRPDTTDPGLDFTVPKDTNALLVALRDLQRRGGEEYVYRIAIEPLGQPDFSLSLDSGRFLVPKDGTALARVAINRAGYNGPVKLQFACAAVGRGLGRRHDSGRRHANTRVPVRAGRQSRASHRQCAGHEQRAEHGNRATGASTGQRRQRPTTLAGRRRGCGRGGSQSVESGVGATERRRQVGRGRWRCRSNCASNGRQALSDPCDWCC